MKRLVSIILSGLMLSAASLAIAPNADAQMNQHRPIRQERRQINQKRRQEHRQINQKRRQTNRAVKHDRQEIRRDRQHN
jgi:Ni/Co efflux regulator RcnB